MTQRMCNDVAHSPRHCVGSCMSQRQKRQRRRKQSPRASPIMASNSSAAPSFAESLAAAALGTSGNTPAPAAAPDSGTGGTGAGGGAVASMADLLLSSACSGDVPAPPSFLAGVTRPRPPRAPAAAAEAGDSFMAQVLRGSNKLAKGSSLGDKGAPQDHSPPGERVAPRGGPAVSPLYDPHKVRLHPTPRVVVTAVTRLTKRFDGHGRSSMRFTRCTTEASRN